VYSEGQRQKPPPDPEIRRRLAGGDPSAIDLLWGCYADRLYAYLTAMLQSCHDAQDALQDVFVQVARKRKKVARARNLQAYLYRMARNSAIDMIRKRTRRQVPTQALDDRWMAPVDGAGEDRGRGEALVEAMARLPSAQRTVLVLKVYQEMTFAEIGEAVGISTNTAASRYRYGIKKLQHMMRSDPI
jgi:RNA polymerase sigma-70 factor, ECF subfamily